MVTGGWLTKNSIPLWANQFDDTMVQRIVEIVHANELPAAAHAHGTDGIAASVRAGVDSIEHCTWLTETGLDMRSDLAREIAARGIPVCRGVSPRWRDLPAMLGEQGARALFDQTGWLLDHGVRLIAGTDAGIPGAAHDGMLDSLAFYTDEVGMDADAVIRMATRDTAEALGLADTGRLVPGAVADLIVAEHTPGRLPGRPHAVLTAGRLHADLDLPEPT